MGEIHPIVSFDGKRTTIYNGRYLRSIKRYREKIKTEFQSKMDTCKKRSRKWVRLLKAKRRTLENLTHNSMMLNTKSLHALYPTAKERRRIRL